MKSLMDVAEGARGTLVKINGNGRFLSRITAIGLTIGTPLELIKNKDKKPVLIYARDTLVAINRSECEKLFMEVTHE